jgi:hypothetical protein
MSARYSLRRLLVALALSQALALQALLLSWGGALAVSGEFAGGLGFICSGLSESRGAGGNEPPARPDTHKNCFDACLTAPAVAKLPDPASLFVRPAVYAQVSVPAETPLLEISGTRAFLARAPPMLTRDVRSGILSQHHSRTT